MGRLSDEDCIKIIDIFFIDEPMSMSQFALSLYGYKNKHTIEKIKMFINDCLVLEPNGKNERGFETYIHNKKEIIKQLKVNGWLQKFLLILRDKNVKGPQIFGDKI